MQRLRNDFPVLSKERSFEVISNCNMLHRTWRGKNKLMAIILDLFLFGFDNG